MYFNLYFFFLKENLFNAFCDLRNLFLFQIMKLFFWGSPHQEDLLFYILYTDLQTIWNWFFCLWFKVGVKTHVSPPPIDLQFNQHHFFKKVILFPLKFTFVFKVEIHRREITVLCISFQTVMHRITRDCG